MWKIIKAEITCSKLALQVEALLLLALTIFTLSDVQNFNESTFIGRYFWTMFIGLGIYFLVYLIWAARVKFLRDNLHHRLPLAVKYISLARWIFGIIPLLFAIFFLLILESFVSTIWQIQISRIIGQLGFFTAFLALLFVLRDLSFYLADKSNIIKILVNISFLAISAFGVIFIIILTSPILIEPLFNDGSEILFFIWGIVLSSASVIIYKKRKSFLE